MLNGFINLYKNRGITSNKAIGILKSHLKQNNIKTKVGHFGTLDPMAEGVLPIALGRAARLFNYFIEKKKEYKAIFEFGKQTDTLDSEGTLIYQDNKVVTKQDILSVLPQFMGQQQQMPPKYSAKSIDGKRAYQLARKGIDFQLEEKTITIYSIELVEELGNNCFSFYIVCSGGTYIRALARDIANKINTVGMMTFLKRTVSGAFKSESSIQLDCLNDNLLSYILPMDYLLDGYEKIEISDQEVQTLLNGIKISNLLLPQGIFSVYSKNKLIGIGKNYDGKLEMKTWLL